MTLSQKYNLLKGNKAKSAIHRCPVCKFPMHNGFQLVCEPGVCMHREIPVRYGASVTRLEAA